MSGFRFLNFKTTVQLVLLFSVWTSSALGSDREVLIKSGNTEIYAYQHTVDSTKPYLIYLHGGPGMNSAPAIGSMVHFSEIPLNIIFFDQRGCGKSNRHVSAGQFKFENLLGDLTHVIDFFKLKKVILIGHSFGGFYARKYALNHPERVSAVIEVDGLLEGWEEAIRRFYEFALPYAKRQKSLFEKLNRSESVPADEKVSMQTFCAFSYWHFKGGPAEKMTRLYQKCEAQLSALSRTEKEEIIHELAEDERVLQESQKKQDIFEGWNARDIKLKYPLYSYAYGKKPWRTDNAWKKLSRNYSAEEMKYSPAVDDGVWKDNPEGWGSEGLEDLKKLKVDYYYLYGKYDRLFRSDRCAQLTRSKWGHHHVIEFQNSAHTPLFEEPREFSRVVVKTVNELEMEK